jgi:hypothetical protein
VSARAKNTTPAGDRGAIWRAAGRDQRKRRGRGAGNHYENNPKNTDFGKWDSGRDPVPQSRRAIGARRLFFCQPAQPRGNPRVFPYLPATASRAKIRNPAENLIFYPISPIK